MTFGYKFKRLFTRQDPTNPVAPATQGIFLLLAILN